jgi:hypothetical protein
MIDLFPLMLITSLRIHINGYDSGGNMLAQLFVDSFTDQVMIGR